MAQPGRGRRDPRGRRGPPQAEGRGDDGRGPRQDGPAMTTGRVVAIRIARVAGAPMASVERVAAHAGGGLEGDRYHKGTGEWSRSPGDGRGLTLISADTLDPANAGQPRAAHRRGRHPPQRRGARRSTSTASSGASSPSGRSAASAIRLAEPCTYLEGLVGRPIIRALTHKAGLRADILVDGEIAVGDPIVPGARSRRPRRPRRATDAPSADGIAERHVRRKPRV